jgi:hypothetical protein
MIAAINTTAMSVRLTNRPKWWRNAGRMSTTIETTRSWCMAGYSPPRWGTCELRVEQARPFGDGNNNRVSRERQIEVRDRAR